MDLKYSKLTEDCKKDNEFGARRAQILSFHLCDFVLGGPVVDAKTCYQLLKGLELILRTPDSLAKAFVNKHA